MNKEYYTNILITKYILHTLQQNGTEMSYYSHLLDGNNQE
jgi:hypothetical protein